MNGIDTYLQDHRDTFEQELFELLRIPSISAERAHADDVRRAAQWLVEQFRNLGLATELVETERHPLVYAETPPVAGAPTALVYGHYDVQPPDPLDEWLSPPFEPTIREGNIYARGATDDKGQMFTHVKGVEAWMKTAGSLPMQVKFLIEGEEEVGSRSLAHYLAEHHQKLACDCVVVSDTSQFAPGQPAITYGLRGIAYFEIRLAGPSQDLHSGTFGGAVTNPANVLGKMIASLVDEQGRIRVPHFYDDVIPITEGERQQFEALPFRDQDFMRQIGVEGLSGEEGFSTLERRWVRPTCDVNGVWGGYQGEGEKTVLPARAGAKVSFRLVPHQRPEKISAAFHEWIESQRAPGISLEIIDYHTSPGIVVPLESPFMQAAGGAIEKGFGTPPVFIREGGSIPILTEFGEHLRADVLLLGWGLSDDNTHSPNEKFCRADFHRGIAASAHLWEALARISDES